MQRPQRYGQPLSYAEILRVVGMYVDNAHLVDIRVLETDEGLILQGLVTEGPRAGQRDTYQLTPEDVDGLYQEALARRGQRV